MEISPLILLAVGMITVFTVLVLVVLSGNLLTYLVNKYIPEEPGIGISGTVTETVGALEKSKVSAIVAAVEWVTKGKGRVTKIEKKE
jgi:oxaloacetate decarboxylase (Na+ extruding) subunit gamma